MIWHKITYNDWYDIQPKQTKPNDYISLPFFPIYWSICAALKALKPSLHIFAGISALAFMTTEIKYITEKCVFLSAFLSFFNGKSAFVGYLISKPSLLCHDLTHKWENMDIHNLHKGISANKHKFHNIL